MVENLQAPTAANLTPQPVCYGIHNGVTVSTQEDMAAEKQTSHITNNLLGRHLCMIPCYVCCHHSAANAVDSYKLWHRAITSDIMPHCDMPSWHDGMMPPTAMHLHDVTHANDVQRHPTMLSCHRREGASGESSGGHDSGAVLASMGLRARCCTLSCSFW